MQDLAADLYWPAGGQTRHWGGLHLPASWRLQDTAWAATPLPSSRCWPHDVGEWPCLNLEHGMFSDALIGCCPKPLSGGRNLFQRVCKSQFFLPASYGKLAVLVTLL